MSHCCEFVTKKIFFNFELRSDGVVYSCNHEAFVHWGNQMMGARWNAADYTNIQELSYGSIIDTRDFANKTRGLGFTGLRLAQL